MFTVTPTFFVIKIQILFWIIRFSILRMAFFIFTANVAKLNGETPENMHRYYSFMYAIHCKTKSRI